MEEKGIELETQNQKIIQEMVAKEKKEGDFWNDLKQTEQCV